MDELFSDDRHVEVEATWDVYQPMITAYRASSRTEGTKIMTRLIASIGSSAFFARPATSNSPTEAINGRLEHLGGTALGFRNLTHYTTRSLLEAGGIRPQLHPRL